MKYEVLKYKITSYCSRQDLADSEVNISGPFTVEEIRKTKLSYVNYSD